MPRSMVQDPERQKGELLFGTKLAPVNLSVLSLKTGIPVSTLSSYKAHPDTIPLGRLSRIIKALTLDDGTIVKLLGGKHEGYKKGEP